MANRSERATLGHARRRAKANSLWVEKDGIVLIPLKGGHTAIIDACFREEAAKYHWRARRSHSVKSTNWYAEACTPGSLCVVFLHNLVLSPRVGFQADHIDRDGLNCRLANLRYATPAQNAANRYWPRTKRPYKGVYPRRDRAGFWAAKVLAEGKWHCSHTLFTTPEAAALAYNELARLHHGEFAALNEVKSAI